MAVPETQAEAVAFLSALSGDTAPIETHISLVFRGPDTVWKLRKAVRLSFLDFTRVGDRERFARRELALNAPSAPGLYRDVVAIVRDPEGRLGLGTGTGVRSQAVDWVLRMARVPETDFLDRIAATEGLSPRLLDDLADAVAAYHTGLAPACGVDPVGAMRGVIMGNARAAREAGLSARRVDAWEAAAARRLAGLEPWLRARAAGGYVRRAHGDLHLGNLCLWHGKPVPFDALEFDEDLATIDLGYDLAFLLMDLDRRGRGRDGGGGRAAANRVMNRYVARTGDSGMLVGLPLFLSSRALIRAHVSARMERTETAASYMDAADRYLVPVPAVLVAIGGLPGSGKSTLARAVAPSLGAAPGALVLRSDEVRKRHFGVPPEARLPEAAYARDVSERVFATVTEAAREAVEGGHAVIADATFLDPGHRAAIAAAARATDVPFLGVWLHAPSAELEARIRARRDDASDATIDVLRSILATHPDVPADWLTIDATDAGFSLRRLQEAVRALAPAC